MTTSAIVALGSNLGDSPAILAEALQAIHRLPGTKVVRASSLYTSPPMAGMQQPDYCNAVAAVETDLAPLALLDALQAIELAQGRERHERWGARTLDLDLIGFGDQCIDSERLTVPHYGVAERAFVLLPLFEIAPGYQFADGRQLTTLLAACPPQTLYRKPDSLLFSSGDSPA
ncbi:2-amino-4-hydroxy-6-hydroxymethyldihydropteridine diphosphokinase [Ferrimonas sp.]|uniref:2-amino-4-hydroxy-6- hydroxymethyldihydropteridine diphosphokinase n=1 Tax=Ferrimonas sp. TaxID=2080861 RepID=UPI003A956DA4